MSKRSTKPSPREVARKPRRYESKTDLARALDVSRQALHGWMKADWWPVATVGPWTDDDVLAIQDARAEAQGVDPADDVQRRWKESQIIRNHAATIRIKRESEMGLGRLVDAEAVKCVLRSVIGGGACKTILQQAYWACATAAAIWAESKGVKLDHADRGALDRIMRDALGNPIADAVVRALRHVGENGFGDNVLAGLIDEVKDLAAKIGDTLDIPAGDSSDEVGQLVEALRLVRGDREAEETAKGAEVDMRLALATVESDPRLAAVIAELSMQDDWAQYLQQRKAQGLPVHPAAAVTPAEPHP